MGRHAQVGFFFNYKKPSCLCAVARPGAGANAPQFIVLSLIDVARVGPRGAAQLVSVPAPLSRATFFHACRELFEVPPEAADFTGLYLQCAAALDPAQHGLRLQPACDFVKRSCAKELLAYVSPDKTYYIV